MSMPFRRRRAVVVAALSCCLALFPVVVSRAATLSKGNQLLIQNGLQIQGMATKDDVFHLQTYEDANYTAINWLWDLNTSLHGAAPGFPWARWVHDQSEMPPRAGANEEPYLSKLVALSLGDEKNLNDPAVRDPYINWFNAVKPNYPNTILYANNYGGQVNDAALADFINRAQPDMIAFDTYPWRSNYTTRQPEPPAGGSPTSWYSELRRYRIHSANAGIPLATYRQSFHAVQDYDQKVYRDPSPSEFRLNTFGALAFNVKFLVDFTYNTGASSYFTPPGGDSNPTPLYNELKQVNKEARNLGKALVRLKPVSNTPIDGGQPTTDIQIIRGKHSTGPGTSAPNDIPIGFIPDPHAPNSYTDWEADRNDPYLRGWVVTNTGTKNDGLAGDVIMSWFKPLDESFDGDAFSNEIYMMVTNGLSDATGAAADAHQQVKLNFVDTLATQVIQKLNRETGQIDELALPLVSGRRQLVLELDGGTSDLFKFKTGAPFVGVQAVPEAASAALLLLPLSGLARRRRICGAR
jgi:hypothetical protein